MRTATEMYNYCNENNFGIGWNQNWSLKHFTLIEEVLQSNEEIKMCFMGLHNYISITKHDGNFAYAITNKRFILAQKQVFGKILQTISINTINDVKFSTGMVYGTILIDTTKEKFNVAVDKDIANNIFMKMQDVIMLAKTYAQSISNSKTYSVADELLKLKNLLDMGIITQVEFDKKKKELL